MPPGHKIWGQLIDFYMTSAPTANEKLRKAYEKELRGRRKTRQAFLEPGPGARKRWQEHSRQVRADFARCLGLQIAAKPSDPVPARFEFGVPISTTTSLTATWLRDLSVVSYAPEKVLHQDLMAELAPQTAYLKEQRLLDGYDAVEAAQTALRGNANARLCIEALVLRLSGRIHMGPSPSG